MQDIFAAAGLEKPDISAILSDSFLAEVRGMPQRNLAVELLRKLLRGEINQRGRKNVVQARSFAEMLEQALLRYHNRAIEAGQVIAELIADGAAAGGGAVEGVGNRLTASATLGLTGLALSFRRPGRTLPRGDSPRTTVWRITWAPPCGTG